MPATADEVTLKEHALILECACDSRRTMANKLMAAGVEEERADELCQDYEDGVRAESSPSELEEYNRCGFFADDKSRGLAWWRA